MDRGGHNGTLSRHAVRRKITGNWAQQRKRISILFCKIRYEFDKIVKTENLFFVLRDVDVELLDDPI